MPRRRSAQLRVSLAVAAALPALGGCGHAAGVGPNRTLRIALTEFRMNPQSVRASPGTLTFVVHNFGRLTHNLSILRGGHYTGSTRPIAPGESAQLTVSVTPGTYLMASTILSDQALGEYGTLTVTR
jgi:plastocyanin